VVSLEDAIETLLGVEILDEMDEVADMQQFAKERARIQKNHADKQSKISREDEKKRDEDEKDQKTE
jgi:CBS domain containing-hemolysin-like protein